VRKTALREVEMLRGLHHPHIVSLLDVFRQGGRLFLCFEYLEKTGGCWCGACCGCWCGACCGCCWRVASLVC
jgi:hypothetical protein